MQEFSKKMGIIANDTNKYLKKFFLKKNKYSYLVEPMKYGVFSGGKRFRSTIIVNTGKIFNIDYKKLIIIGAAIECVHSYSLIHDDLPTMDNDDLRRGKPATHKRFNEFTAILAGNSLLTLAFEILSSKNLTGKLFAFCCECAGIIREYNFNKRKMLKKMGLDVGLLFQIVDDLIDFKGDSKIVGKPTKSDKKKGKPTLINLLGYKETLNFANNLKNKIDKKIINYGIKSNDLLQSVQFIIDRKF